MYKSASQLILARSNLRLGFRSILLFTITITVDTSAQVVLTETKGPISHNIALARVPNSTQMNIPSQPLAEGGF